MFAFLIAACAGYMVPLLEDALGRPVVKMLRGSMPVDENETRTVTILAVLLVVSLLAVAFESGNAFGIALGLALGYFGTRLFAAIKSAVDGK